MPRPKKCRKVCSMPVSIGFSPDAWDFSDRDTVYMTVDEYETIRLIDYRGFNQEECAGYMEIARTTVQQIYNDARKKLSVMLVEGKRLKIGGGDYQLCQKTEAQCMCGGCKRHRNWEQTKID